MRNLLTRHKYPLGMLVIVLILVLLAVVISGLTGRSTSSAVPATPKLIPPASIYHAPSTGGGPVWGGETWVPSPFRRAQLHHPWCGRRISPQVRGVHGIYRMWFQHCAMAFGPIKVYHYQSAKPTPLPEQGAVGGILGGTATPQPHPTQTPVVIYLPPPTAAPAATPVPPASAAVDFELSLMNQSRASLGLPPYVFNPIESSGSGTCPGSQGHADHMAQAGAISHDQFPNDICIAYSTAGENVGEAGGYGVQGALSVIHQQMMAETPFSYGCTGSHRCNIMSPAFRQVGIGIATVNGTTFMAVDFAG